MPEIDIVRQIFSSLRGLFAAERRKAGRTVDLRDTLIAGIALARRASIATRNTGHFDGLDVPVIDPWGEPLA